jgi:hypothetical protein
LEISTTSLGKSGFNKEIQTPGPSWQGARRDATRRWQTQRSRKNRRFYEKAMDERDVFKRNRVHPPAGFAHARGEG